MYEAVAAVLFIHCCFFFFQAEDGIRDATVTGVQTCALPILIARLIAFLIGDSTCPSPSTGSCPPTATAATSSAAATAPPPRSPGATGRPQSPRSEERRVGKECRCR